MNRSQANCLLLIAAGCWGVGSVAQKTVLEHLDPLVAVGLRCLIATVLVAPFALAERQGKVEHGWAPSLFRVAGLFALAMSVQQTAFLGTSVTNASFLVNTATVMTPLAAWWLLRERPGGQVAIAAGLTLVGALLMSGGSGGPLAAGDRLVLLSAALYALWLVELSRHMRRFGRPVMTAAGQFGMTALLLVPAIAASGTLTLPTLLAAGPELLVLGVFSTAVAFGLQTAAQRHTSASHAAIVVSAESVFGAVAAAVLLGERLSSVGALGGLLVLAAIALVALWQVPPRQRMRGTAGGGVPGPDKADDRARRRGPRRPADLARLPSLPAPRYRGDRSPPGSTAGARTDLVRPAGFLPECDPVSYQGGRDVGSYRCRSIDMGSATGRGDRRA